MKLDELLNALFPQGHKVTITNQVVIGAGKTKTGEIAVLGTTDHAYIGVEHALALAAEIINVIKNHPGRAILLLVDTQGQRLSRRDELLGINGFLAHVAKCLEFARSRGHKIVSLAYGEAVSGGFLSCGMVADETYALPDAQVRVMNLPAMSRVTKVPLERLKELSKTSPVFAPGVPSFLTLGGVAGVWGDSLSEKLEAALGKKTAGDKRRELGLAHGGRLLAHGVSKRVREEKLAG